MTLIPARYVVTSMLITLPILSITYVQMNILSMRTIIGEFVPPAMRKLTMPSIVMMRTVPVQYAAE